MKLVKYSITTDQGRRKSEGSDDIYPPNVCKYRKENINSKRQYNTNVPPQIFAPSSASANKENATNDNILDNSVEMSTQEAKTDQMSKIVAKVHKGEIIENKSPSNLKMISIETQTSKIEKTDRVVQTSETPNHENRLCEMDLVKQTPLRSVKTSQESYICQRCNRIFRHKISLEEHEKTHWTLKKPVFEVKKPQESYSCSHSDKEKLSKHDKICTEKNTFQCTFCPCTFRIEHQLKKHISFRHPDLVVENSRMNLKNKIIESHCCKFCFENCKSAIGVEIHKNRWCKKNPHSESKAGREIDEMKDTKIKSRNDDLVDSSNLKTKVIDFDKKGSKSDTLIDSRTIKKVYEGKKQFQCKICKACFPRKSKLIGSQKEIIFSHTAIKYQLKRHIASRHPNSQTEDPAKGVAASTFLIQDEVIEKTSENKRQICIKKEMIDLDLHLEKPENISMISSRNIKKEPNDTDNTVSDDKSLINITEMKKEQFDDLVQPMETCENESENIVETSRN